MTTNVPANAAGNAIASIKQMKQGLANVQRALPPVGGTPILKLQTDGNWTFGADNTEMEDGSLWAANPFSLQHGYICWKYREQGSKEQPELLGEVMVSMFDPKPLKSSLPDYGAQNQWKDQVSILFKCIEGEDEGEQVIYKPSSMGGTGEMDKFIKAIMAADDTTPCPVVKFDSDFYNNKKTGGRTYIPILEIVDWMPLDGFDDEPEDKPEPEPVKEPEQAQRTSRRAAAPEPAQEEQRTEPAPAAATAESGERRRRRRAA